MAKIIHKNISESVVKYSLNNIAEAKEKLWERIITSDLSLFSFKKNVRNGAYNFDFYSQELNLGLQLDAYSFCFEETYNNDYIKVFTIGSSATRVIKLTDYQVIIDMDEVMRFLKSEIENKRFAKVLA